MAKIAKAGSPTKPGHSPELRGSPPTGGADGDTAADGDGDGEAAVTETAGPETASSPSRTTVCL